MNGKAKRGFDAVLGTGHATGQDYAISMVFSSGHGASAARKRSA